MDHAINDADDLNDINVEAPGGTQATHAGVADDTASESGTTQANFSDFARRPRVRRRDRAIQGLSDVRNRSMNRLRDYDVGDARGDLESRIREHPVASMAVAVLAGFLLAKIT